jgi:hypothetical protein
LKCRWLPFSALKGGRKFAIRVPVRQFPFKRGEPLLERRSLLLCRFSFFLDNAISVALLSWPFVPAAIGAFGWWLLPAQDAPGWTAAAGAMLVGGL